MQNDVHEIEMSIEEANRKIKKMKDLDDLVNNPIFDELITTGYLEQEPARLALLTTDPMMQEPLDQDNLFSRIKGIGHFREFLMVTRREGKAAQSALVSHEEELELAHAEEAEDSE